MEKEIMEQSDLFTKLSHIIYPIEETMTNILHSSQMKGECILLCKIYGYTYKFQCVCVCGNARWRRMDEL